MKIKSIRKKTIDFFRNQSMWFQSQNFDTTIDSENIFFASHLGQLAQIEALIEYESLVSSYLFVLYTPANLRMPNLIMESYNRELFDGCTLHLLPKIPNDYSPRKLFYMKRGYKKILSKVSSKNLYLLSFENHYVILAFLAKKKGLNLSLIDEGTATYKDKGSSLYVKKSGLFGRMISRMLLNSELSIYSRFDKFDRIYAAFPEQLKTMFDAGEYLKFFPHSNLEIIDENNKLLLNKYKINSNDIVYVNQSYPVRPVDFVNAVMIILKDVSSALNARVFIKMHPKDKLGLILEFSRHISRNQSAHEIILIIENEFLVDTLIKFSKPRAVIGLTSTSLVYAPLMSSKTAAISIAPLFLSTVSKKGNAKGINIILNHLEVLKQFSHVSLSKSNSEVVNILNKGVEAYVRGSSSSFFISNARDAWKAGKYRKTIANYLWGTGDELESLEAEDSLILFNSLLSLGHFDAFESTIRYLSCPVELSSCSCFLISDSLNILLTKLEELRDDGDFTVYLALFNSSISFKDRCLLEYKDIDKIKILLNKEFSLKFKKEIISYYYDVNDFYSLLNVAEREGYEVFIKEGDLDLLNKIFLAMKELNHPGADSLHDFYVNKFDKNNNNSSLY